MNVEGETKEQVLTPKESRAMDYVFGVVTRPYGVFCQPKRFTPEQLDQVLADYEALLGIAAEEKREAMERERQLGEEGAEGVLKYLKEDFYKKEHSALLKAFQDLVDQEGPIHALRKLIPTD